MLKVSKMVPSLCNPERGEIEIRIEIPGVGAHWIKCHAILTDWGWQALDGEKRDIGICAGNLPELGRLIVQRLESKGV